MRSCVRARAVAALGHGCGGGGLLIKAANSKLIGALGVHPSLPIGSGRPGSSGRSTGRKPWPHKPTTAGRAALRKIGSAHRPARSTFRWGPVQLAKCGTFQPALTTVLRGAGRPATDPQEPPAERTIGTASVRATLATGLRTKIDGWRWRPKAARTPWNKRTSLRR